MIQNIFTFSEVRQRVKKQYWDIQYTGSIGILAVLGYKQYWDIQYTGSILNIGSIGSIGI